MAGIDLALFYLARRAEGLGSFQRFVDSYKANGAGVDHSLVVIYKGFERDRDLALLVAPASARDALSARPGDWNPPPAESFSLTATDPRAAGCEEVRGRAPAHVQVRALGARRARTHIGRRVSQSDPCQRRSHR